EFLETIDGLHRAQPQLATVLVTHHLEELPETTTHALLVSGGRVTAAGPAEQVLTSEGVSECFAYPIQIGHQDGRWFARAGRGVLTEATADARRRAGPSDDAGWLSDPTSSTGITTAHHVGKAL